MATTTAPPPTALENMRNVHSVADYLPADLLPANLDLGSDAAEGIIKQNLSKGKLGAAPVVSVPEPKSPEQNPVAPVAEPVKDPVAPEPKADPVSEFKDEDLLKALESSEVPPVNEKPDAKIEVTKEEGKPVIPADDISDADAPIEVPKTAKDQQAALIATSKLLRERNREIKALKEKGNPDVAAISAEPLKQKIAALEAEKEQWLNITAQTRVEQHPAIQTNLIQPMQAAGDFIRNIANLNDGVSENALFKAAQEPDPAKRRAATKTACADLEPEDRLQVIQAVEAINRLGGELGKVRANAKDIAARMDKEAQDKNIVLQTQRRAESVKAHEASFKEFAADPIISTFSKKNPEFKKQLDGLLEKAKAAELDPKWIQDDKQRSVALQKSLAYDMVTSEYKGQLKTLLTQLKKVMDQNVKLRAPGLSLGGRPAGNLPQPPAKEVPWQNVVDKVFSQI